MKLSHMLQRVTVLETFEGLVDGLMGDFFCDCFSYMFGNACMNITFFR
jgi:hypothetical protein